MKKLLSFLFFVCIIALNLVIVKELFATSLKDRYVSAKKDFNYIERSRNVTRKSYDLVAKKFHSIYIEGPNSYLADDALFYCATTYYKSYIKFKNSTDLREALKYYRLVAVNYKSNLASKSYIKSADIYIILDDYASAKFMLERLIAKFPGGRNKELARRKIAEIDKKFNMSRTSIIKAAPALEKQNINEKYSDGIGDKVLITNIRYWSSPTYTRIVIDLSGKADYRKEWLKEDPKNNKPPRLFVDVFNAKVAENVSKNILIKDGLVSTVRWGYFKDGTTRIVLDSENIKDFSLFYLESPNRIVIDVSGDGKTLVGVRKGDIGANTDTLAGVFGLKIKRVVVDAGHGGKDPGASYYGLYEKDITLDIALELKRLLDTQTDLEIYMTRDRDVFIPLEERTAIANKKKADIFVSVHINASKNRNTSGVETYVLNVTNDKSALEVAAFENQATEKSLSDLQSILKDIMLNSKLEESTMLATFVQDSLTAYIRKNSLGVKQAPFYVLVGATMPSILVEADFISNRSVSNNYKDLNYRKKVAKGIFNGVMKYIDKYNGKK